jgi:hypothetical protein
MVSLSVSRYPLACFLSHKHGKMHSGVLWPFDFDQPLIAQLVFHVTRDT